MNHSILTLLMVLSGSIEFTPMQVIPISGMIAGNAMVAVGLSTIIACYLTYRKFYNSRHQLVVTPLKKP